MISGIKSLLHSYCYYKYLPGFSTRQKQKVSERIKKTLKIKKKKEMKEKRKGKEINCLLFIIRKINGLPSGKSEGESFNYLQPSNFFLSSCSEINLMTA